MCRGWSVPVSQAKGDEEQGDVSGRRGREIDHGDKKFDEFGFGTMKGGTERDLAVSSDRC